jgi:hypothetical protein
LPLKDDYLKCITKLVSLKFNYPLLTSLKFNRGIWNSNNNLALWKEMQNLGVKN